MGAAIPVRPPMLPPLTIDQLCLGISVIMPTGSTSTRLSSISVRSNSLVTARSRKPRYSFPLADVSSGSTLPAPTGHDGTAAVFPSHNSPAPRASDGTRDRAVKIARQLAHPLAGQIDEVPLLHRHQAELSGRGRESVFGRWQHVSEFSTYFNAIC